VVVPSCEDGVREDVDPKDESTRLAVDVGLAFAVVGDLLPLLHPNLNVNVEF
jgi:hypothetical protein